MLISEFSCNNGVINEVYKVSINLNRTIMRNLKTLLLVATLAFSSVLSASTNDEAKEAQSSMITTEIGKLLKNPSFDVENEITASVTITLNKNNEMVVLSVDSKDGYFDNYIKNRLNYQELPVTLTTGTKTFKVPVRVTPEK